MNLPKAICVDIDGTIANIDHRLHHVRRKPKNWPEFFKEMSKDSVNEWCQNLVYLYFNAGYKIIFVSGRGEEYRRATETWLDEKAQVYHTAYELYMRPEKDYRQDDIIKEEIYLTKIKDKYNVEVVIDDRPRVCRKWRELGLLVLQCNDKEF